MALINHKVGAHFGLGLGFGAEIAMMIVIAVLGIANIRSTQDELDIVVNKEFSKTVSANNMLEGVNAIGILMRDSLMVSGQANIQSELDSSIAKRKIIKNDLDKLQTVITSDADKAALAKVVDARTKHVAVQENFIKLVEEGKQEEAKAYLLEDVMQLQDSDIEKYSELTEYQTGVLKMIGDEANEQAGKALTLIIAIAVIALIPAVIIGFMIARSITHPLQEAVDIAAAVDKGNLTQRIEVKSSDEVG